MKLPFQTRPPSVPAPEGAHVGRLVRVVDIGTQTSFFQEKEITARKLNIAWELYCDRMEDGRPFMVSERYTMSLNEKASLHKMLYGWLGKEFEAAAKAGSLDFSTILGRPCLITVAHREGKTGNLFAKISGVTQIPKGLKPDEQVNPSWLFDLSAPDMTIFDQLPKWQQEEISKSPEWQSRNTHPGDESTDAPF